MKTKPIFDVIVTFAGRFDMLEKCLDSIYRNATVPLSITIVDDASDKEEKSHYPQLFVYNFDKDVHKNVVSFSSKRHENTEGFPKTVNDGAKSSRAKYITVLNDDIELHDGYFQNVLSVFAQDDRIGICGSRLLFSPTSTHPNRPAGKVQHIGLALDIRANVVHPLVGWSADNPKTLHNREVLGVTGGAFTILGDIWRRVGGLDTIYGLGTYEDIDLCLKVRQLGYKIWMDTSVSAYHYVGATVEKKKISYPLQQNAMIFKSRWGSTGLLLYDAWSYG